MAEKGELRFNGIEDLRNVLDVNPRLPSQRVADVDEREVLVPNRSRRVASNVVGDSGDANDQPDGLRNGELAGAGDNMMPPQGESQGRVTVPLDAPLGAAVELLEDLPGDPARADRDGGSVV